MNETVSKLSHEVKVLKSTPLPNIDYLGKKYNANTNPGSSIPMPAIYEAVYNSPELQIIFSNLSREIFRNGYEWKAKNQAVCPQCSKTYDYTPGPCEVCGFQTKEFDPKNDAIIKKVEDLFKCANGNQETFLHVIRQCEEDLQASDHMFLVLLKDYYYDSNGEIFRSEIKGMIRGSPERFVALMDNNGQLGRNLSGEMILVCPEHRDVEYYGSSVSNCKSCNKKLYPAHFKATSDRQGLPSQATYYLADEVIWTNKYHPQRFGYSPVISVWNIVHSLRAMVLYVREYYSKMRPPKGMVLVNTSNALELEKSWEKMLASTQGNPHAIHPVAVQSGSTGSVAQFIDFMNNLTESQYVEVRQEFRTLLGARFGVMPLFQGDASSSGGLNNEGLQVTVTNRAVSHGQSIWNEIVFPRLLKQFNVSDYELCLKPSEEQDETAEIDRDLKKAQYAQMMKGMGFKVTLGANGEFDYENPDPAQLLTNGQNPFESPETVLPGEAQNGFQGTTDQGEPTGTPVDVGKAVGLRDSFGLKKKLFQAFQKELKSLDLSRKPSKERLLKFAERFSQSLSFEMRKVLDDSIVSIYRRAGEDVAKELKMTWGFSGVDEQAIQALRKEKIFDLAFKNLNDSVNKRLQESIRLAYAEPRGLSVEKIVDRMVEAVDVEKARLETIARTETHHISMIARKNSYKSAGGQKNFLYKWIGPDDYRTTPICKILSEKTANGVTFSELQKLIKEVSEENGSRARDLTPHPNCRHVFIRSDVLKIDNEQERLDLASRLYGWRGDIYYQRGGEDQRGSEKSLLSNGAANSSLGKRETNNKLDLQGVQRKHSFTDADKQFVHVRHKETNNDSLLVGKSNSSFEGSEKTSTSIEGVRGIETRKDSNSEHIVKGGFFKTGAGDILGDKSNEPARTEELLKSYYSDRYFQHGDSAEGVGWKNQDVQTKRFEKLADFLDISNNDNTVLDVGAGLGHFQKYLKEKGYEINYSGIDVDSAFVEKASELGRNVMKDSLFDHEIRYDFVVCSGAFNTKGTELLSAIHKMNELAKEGFAFNFLKPGNYQTLQGYSPEAVEKKLGELEGVSSYKKIEGYLDNDVTYYVYKEKVYLSPGEKAPEGVTPQKGPNGGSYYETGEKKPVPKPEREPIPPVPGQRVLPENVPADIQPVHGLEQPTNSGARADEQDPQIKQFVEAARNVPTPKLFQMTNESMVNPKQFPISQRVALRLESARRLIKTDEEYARADAAWKEPDVKTLVEGKDYHIGNTAPLGMTNVKPYGSTGGIAGKVVIDSDFWKVATPDQRARIVLHELYHEHLKKNIPEGKQHWANEVMAWSKYFLSISEQESIDKQIAELKTRRG